MQQKKVDNLLSTSSLVYENDPSLQSVIGLSASNWQQISLEGIRVDGEDDYDIVTKGHWAGNYGRKICQSHFPLHLASRGEPVAF